MQLRNAHSQPGSNKVVPLHSASSAPISGQTQANQYHEVDALANALEQASITSSPGPGPSPIPPNTTPPFYIATAIEIPFQTLAYIHYALCESESPTPFLLPILGHRLLSFGVHISPSELLETAGVLRRLVELALSAGGHMEGEAMPFVYREILRLERETMENGGKATLRKWWSRLGRAIAEAQAQREG